jgi:AcrR family transcriptional regulator
MKTPPAVKNRPRANDRPRGRPRSVEARRAILKAARELLSEGGMSSVTIERIAARAGVGKPTIYRSWPNAHAVAMAALMESDQAASTPPFDGSAQTRSPESALEALRMHLHQVGRIFSAPLGRNVAMMIAAADRDTELSKVFRNHFILARRNEGRVFLERAIAAGEIRNDVDLDVALDLIYAPVFHRLLLGHAALNAQFTDEVLDLVLCGIADPGRKR